MNCSRPTVPSAIMALMKFKTTTVTGSQNDNSQNDHAWDEIWDMLCVKNKNHYFIMLVVYYV